MRLKRILLSGFVASLMALAIPLRAQSDGLTINLTATYWIMAENDQDTGPSKCCGTVTNLVLNQLGPDGLPLVNPAYVMNGSIKDVNSKGEITWWSPSFNSDVSFLGTGTASLPLFSFEYPPSGNDFNGFLTAEFQGTFTLPSAAKIAFTTSSDDDSLLYIDGNLVVDNGGVKSLGTVSGTDILGPGLHSLTLFFADRDPTGSFVQVSDTVSPTPEPATLSLLGIGLLGIVGVIKRRKENVR
jgi:hypothetical protein